jgi:hypothetical protein
MFTAAAADKKYFHQAIFLVGGRQGGLPGPQYGIRLNC